MMKKIVLLAFALVLLSTAMIGRLTKPVEASGTIYIRADGSVDGTTDISTVDNVTYTFTGDINDQIVVQRNNTVIDGAGYAVQGTGAFESKGIDLQQVSNVTIKNATIKGFYYGIHFNSTSYNILLGNNITANEWYGVFFMFSSNNSIVGNNITDNSQGIRLYRSSNNLLLGNTIKNNDDGITLWISCSNNTVCQNNIANNTHCNVWIQESSENVIAGNNIVDSEWGIGLDYSPNNEVYHNYFAANDRQVVFINARINIWDNGYPSGGNYWSNYTGLDLCSGPYQNVAGSDGIGDTSHVIDGNNTDRYPLMQPYNGPVRNLNTGESYVSLIGENKYNTIVDGNNTGTVMNVTAGNVNINGFTIRNSGEWPNSGIRLDSVNTCYMSNLNVANHSLCGIRLYSSNKNTLTSSTITNSQYGIQLTYSEDNIVTHNTVTNNSLCGILLEDSNNNTLTDNIVTNNLDGIRLGYSSNNNTVTNNNVTNQREHGVRLYELSNNNDLKNNTITNNGMNGIWLYSSNNNTVTGNTITNNHGGIRLDHSSNNNTLTDNTITNNHGYGILLDDSDNNWLTSNTIANHILCGILLDYSSIKNIVTSNTIANNTQYGILLDHQSDKNKIYHNNFIDNTNHAHTDGSINTWDNGTKGNYWSDYEERYLNATEIDGIWDTPYVIDENNQDNYPIVPEFPTWTTMLFILIVLMVAVIIYKRRLLKHQ